MRRGLKSLPAVAALLALAGCATPGQPQVTFYSHGDSVRVAPVRYCDPSGRECSDPKPANTGKLGVPPDAPLQISVPEELSSAAWQVIFRYRTDDGRQEEGRSTVFGPQDQRHAYTLRLPPQAAQLERVEVQRYSGDVSISPEGDILFGIGGSWALNTHPEQQAPGSS